MMLIDEKGVYYPTKKMLSADMKPDNDYEALVMLLSNAYEFNHLKAIRPETEFVV